MVAVKGKETDSRLLEEAFWVELGNCQGSRRMVVVHWLQNFEKSKPFLGVSGGWEKQLSSCVDMINLQGL